MLYIYIYIYIYIYHYILNLLFAIIKFIKNGENSIVLATIVGKLPLCLISLLKI